IHVGKVLHEVCLGLTRLIGWIDIALVDSHPRQLVKNAAGLDLDVDSRSDRIFHLLRQRSFDGSWTIVFRVLFYARHVLGNVVADGLAGSNRDLEAIAVARLLDG